MAAPLSKSSYPKARKRGIHLALKRKRRKPLPSDRRGKRVGRGRLPLVKLFDTLPHKAGMILPVSKKRLF